MRLIQVLYTEKIIIKRINLLYIFLCTKKVFVYGETHYKKVSILSYCGYFRNPPNERKLSLQIYIIIFFIEKWKIRGD